jgi:hypothetical protein
MATSVDSSKTGEGGGGLPAASSADVQEATSDQVAVTPLSLAESDVYAEKTYVDELVVGVLRDRGNYDASGNTFPASGGSGAAGAIKKGDLWYISVAGTLGSAAVAVGDTVRALADTPGQTAGNWAVMENNLGYVPERSIDAATAKTTPADADTMGIIDSAASNVLKKITWANIKAAIKSYLDAFYVAVGAGGGWQSLGTFPIGTGSNLDISGIPSTAREIYFSFNGISFSNTVSAVPLIQPIVSGSPVTSGFNGRVHTNSTIVDTTAGIPIFHNSMTGAESIEGDMRIFCLDSTSHIYKATGLSWTSVRSCDFGASFTLAGQVAGFRIQPPNSLNLDGGGSVTIYYR